MKPLYIVRRENDELWVFCTRKHDVIYTTDIAKALRFNRRNARRVAARIGGVMIEDNEFKGANGHG